MKKFFVFYHAPAAAMAKMAQVTPEEMKKGMEPWMAWTKKCGKALVDLGNPLGNAHKVSVSFHGKTESTLSGYSILKAESLETVYGLIKDHPHLSWVKGAEIEVFEVLPMRE